ncbi:transposase [Thermodesulfobacteriota bacterium]
MAGTARQQVCQSLEVTQRAERAFWTAKVFHGYLSETYEPECSYRTVVRFFHNQGFALKVPQPWPDRQDEQQREAFCQKLNNLLQDETIDIWFADESGFEGDPRHRRLWDRKGSKTRVTKNGDHLRMNVMGMVCPRTGQFFAIETSHSDAETFQAILDVVNNSDRNKKT